MKIKTYLPIFQGFYGTKWEALDEQSDIDYINELRKDSNIPGVIGFEDCVFDYDKYYNELAGSITERVEAVLSQFVRSIEYENTYSPKEYNFTNDSINCTINPKFNVIKKYIRENYADWAGYLKYHYTSRDGFMSFHDNFPESDEWNMDRCLKDSHGLGSVLSFIAENEDIGEDDIYYESIEDIYLELTNYDELLKMIKTPEVPDILKGKLEMFNLSMIKAHEKYISQLIAFDTYQMEGK